ncbi:MULTISPECIES: DUF2071 domain-containing protein [unclassified Acinetobacter]|uniref:DUF2071 domain-containing protein n=1 Tax=unclassified Acinetobacter TaxID=196816 RepID=UPI001F4AB3C3|nr:MULTISPECIES: DUF2071 domain-containing protein [unclassified Acinetobacter]MCH7350993.1 DUF2071 domain-containing protein [Acinetobacter sp. NIPH 2023]MCH7358634.1 DUF2071 domain-containing protein [Acinetobacter sp. NIPH 2024]
MNRHHFKLPPSKPLFRFLAPVLSCRLLLQLRRLMMRILPFMPLQSRVSNIVYLSWLVDIEQVRQHYPQSVPLWEKDGKTIFTILIYQHHHFGFKFFGWLRKLMPSPRQSNWRFYLDESQPKTVIFEQVIVDQALYVIGGRLASDVMPAQYASLFEHQFDEQRLSIHTELKVDEDYCLISDVHITEEKQLPTKWQMLFPSWEEAVRFLVDQDHAWAEWGDQPARMSQGDIKMPFQFQQIQAAKIRTLQAPQLLQQFGLDDTAEAFAFVVPALDFYVVGEKILSTSN